MLKRGIFMKNKGILFIISGPSGSGKGTVVSELIKNGGFSLSISATTRPPRAGEQEGRHYFFKTREEFDKMRNCGELLEWAEFCGNFYGTPKAYVEGCLERGENVILEIEVQGALKVKELMPESVLIFLMAPDVHELRRRLTNRATEDAQTIDRRVDRAIEELNFVSSYDYVIINESVEQAKAAALNIAAAEGMKVSRNAGIKDVFKGES